MTSRGPWGQNTLALKSVGVIEMTKKINVRVCNVRLLAKGFLKIDFKVFFFKRENALTLNQRSVLFLTQLGLAKN
jgi:hypothetical protein